MRGECFQCLYGRRDQQNFAGLETLQRIGGFEPGVGNGFTIVVRGDLLRRCGGEEKAHIEATLFRKRCDPVVEVDQLIDYRMQLVFEAELHKIDFSGSQRFA